MESMASSRHETGFGFLSKAGNRHGLPLFSKDSAGHRITAHGKVQCSACHAQWSYQDYGLSVIREDVIQGDKWRGLTAQGDPYLQEVLERGGEHQGVWYPSSRDWISGKDRQGIWSIGWRFRRWELMPLGVDHRGQYAIIRPMYQYHISAVDRLGNTVLDNRIPSRGDGSGKGWAFIPYVPHTISPVGRACDTCHGNRVAAGLGIEEKPTLDTGLTLPSPAPIRTMRILTTPEQERLMRPSATWKRERLRVLMGE